MARPSRSPAEWSAIVDRYLASGLTQRAFCEHNALSFDAFRNQYQKSEKFAGKRRRPATDGGFVDVTPRRRTSPSPTASADAAAFIVRLGSSVSIDCPASTPLATVASLARALADSE